MGIPSLVGMGEVIPRSVLRPPGKIMRPLPSHQAKGFGVKAPGVVRECEHPGKPHSHGKECYRYDGCRCPAGRGWSAEEARTRRSAQIRGVWEPTYVPAVGAQRRIQALMTMGYDVWLISDAARINRRTGYEILHGLRPGVARSTHDAISSLYAEPSIRERVPRDRGERIADAMTRARARKGGYLPPDCWDVDTIDDPEATPNLVALAGKAAGYPYSIRLALATQLMEEFPEMHLKRVEAVASLAGHTVRKLSRGELAA